MLGFSRRLSALVPLSHGDSPLPFLLFASRLLPSPFVSFYTFSGVPCDFALTLLCFHFIGFYRIFAFSCFCFFVGFLRIVAMPAWYFFYFTDLCPFANPIDRMQFWLFFLYLCRLILLRWPLSVHTMVTLSSLFAVSHTCLGLPSCCYSFASPVVSMRLVLSSIPLPTSSYSLAYWRSDPRLFLFYVCNLSSMSWPSLLWFLLWGLFQVFFPSRSRSLSLYTLSFGSVR